MAELNVREVAGGGAAPARWLAVLHGIYGAGRNWASVARAIVDRKPDLGGLLVDLRQHGGSVGFAPPHTIAAAAADLDGLERFGPVRAMLGHSFGGKVALARATGGADLSQVWVIDSTPEARDPAGGAWEMLRALRALPEAFDSREEAVDALAAQGVERPVALWMTTNLDWQGERYRWRIDLDDMEALLLDFFRTDLWEVVESPPPDLEIHFVRATGSPILGAEAVDRLRAAGQATGRVFLHEIRGGHWLNADNPDGLVELIAPRL